MNTTAIILAAGKGTRMKSDIPKVLHRMEGMSLLEHVVSRVEPLVDRPPAAVIGFGGEMVQDALGDRVRYVWQHEQLGTGHAVMQAGEILRESDTVLVLCGDTPLLRTETLEALIREHRQSGNQATVLSVLMEDPTGYGRLVRDPEGELQEIVEHRDCTAEQLNIREINSGTYCFSGSVLADMLERLTPDNDQKEYYLTDVIRLIRREGGKTGGYLCSDPEEIMGINSRVQLAEASRIMRRRINRHWMEEGVAMVDPESVYIGASVRLSPDVEIWPGVILEGETTVGRNTVLGPGCRIRDSVIGNNCRLDQAIVLESVMGDGCAIGPFAYIRPGCRLGDRVKIGDFVEIKKTSVGEGSKLPHHSYIGDAVVGAGVNIGAGTITCNYDGVNKYQTIIGDGVFVGSNSNLVAPVNLGRRAYVAAGSTITCDVPEESLGLARERQKNIEGWRRKKGL